MSVAPQRHGGSPEASPSVWLASRSPRRASLLGEAGIAATTLPADIDDGCLRHGDVSPEWWVMALAYLKARRVADRLREVASEDSANAPSLVLGADTVCAIGRSVLGQPRDADDARRMLRLLSGREHRTITGVCLLLLRRRDWRLIVFDAALVSVGELSQRQIDDYLATGDWRGKAGAYNLAERQQAGWPITCQGDPATVMGLPMQRLKGWLRSARQFD